MQHVGIGQHDVRAPADRLARVLRRVAVVGEGADRVGADRRRGGERVELGSWSWASALVGKRYSARAVGSRRTVQDRQVVTERLAAGGRRDDDDVAAGGAAAKASAWWE